MSLNTQNPFARIISEITKPFYARETETTAMLTCLLAGYNAVLIGQPGTAKSALAKRVLEALPAPSFSCLLHAFSDPDDTLGSISLTELKKDRRVRNTSGYLPSVQYAFIDEIFKARSAMLTALLSLLNERVYMEEGKAQPTLLKAIIGASNEFPDEESGALADRFAMFIPVSYCKDKKAFLQFALNEAGNHESLVKKDSEGKELRMITTKFLRETSAKIDEVLKNNVNKITDTLMRFDDIVDKKAGVFKDAKLSDRSLIQCARLLATSCVMRQGTEVMLEDAWAFGFLARSFEHQTIYQESCKELLKSTETLEALKDRLRRGARSDLTSVENALPNLPIHWQIDLQNLLQRALQTSNNIKNSVLN
jgi:MoxR-like ATPase